MSEKAFLSPLSDAAAAPAPAVVAVPLGVSVAGAVPRVSSAQLLRYGPQLEIEHEGGIYRLRRTAAGKLILTK